MIPPIQFEEYKANDMKTLYNSEIEIMELPTVSKHLIFLAETNKTFIEL